MVKVGLFVRLKAKPGKEAEVVSFLNKGLGLANEETNTPIWFALQLGPSTFGISMLSTMRQDGQPICASDRCSADGQCAELLAENPQIEHVDILGAKLSQ